MTVIILMLAVDSEPSVNVGLVKFTEDSRTWADTLLASYLERSREYVLL